MNLLKQTLNWANVYHLDPPHKGTYWISVKLRKNKNIHNLSTREEKYTTIIIQCIERQHWIEHAFKNYFSVTLKMKGLKTMNQLFFGTRVLTIRFPVIKYFNWVINIVSSFMGSLISTCTSKHLISKKKKGCSRK